VFSLHGLIFMRIFFIHISAYTFNTCFIIASAVLYKNLVFVKFMMVFALFYFFLFTKAEICCLPHETHFSDVWYKRS